LIEEDSLATISTKFNISRGEVQDLQNTSSIFANQVLVFCARMGFESLAVLIANLCDRLTHGVKAELIPLMQLLNVKTQRARLLFQAGFQTIESIATASVDKLAQALAKSSFIGTSSNSSSSGSRDKDIFGGLNVGGKIENKDYEFTTRRTFEFDGSCETNSEQCQIFSLAEEYL